MNKHTWLLLAAAFCGALVSLQIERNVERTLFEKIAFVFCGLMISFFVTPLITTYWHLNEPGQISAIGFLIALCWQNLYNKFTTGIDNTQLPFQADDQPCQSDKDEMDLNVNDNDKKE